MNPMTLDGMAHFFRRRIEEQREQIVELCGRLVAARSVNPVGDTREVASEVLAALKDAHVTGTLHSRVETMPSVVAELESERSGPHLILNVHLDTMPPGDERAWTVPPYQLTRKEGRLYGLGMGNMKGSVAAMIHAVRLLRTYPEMWRGKITFTAVSDEVVFGENGAAYLLETIPSILGDGMLCGEGPGFRRLAIGEKGVLWLDLSADGEPGHASSVRRLASATARLAAAIIRIDQLNGSRATVPSDLAGFLPDDPGFELTANVGVIDAGTFIGQIATEGHAAVDFRVPPGMSTVEVEDMVRAIAREVGGVSVARLKGWEPNWTSHDGVLGSAWSEAARALGTPTQELAIRLPASDASRWRIRGTPALCFGPQPTYSSGIDDYAEEDEVLRCAALFATTAIGFLNSARPSHTRQDDT
jgi:succinyl-diaminopimelate desuccinylase